MRADNAQFAQYNTAASKRPRVVIRVSFDVANTDFLYFTSHPDCDLPAGAVSAGIAIENCVRSISGQSQQINPDQANSTIGGFNYSIVDTGKSSTIYLRDKLIAGFGLRHKQVVAYIGYQGMLWADYQQVLTYIIDNDVTYLNGEYKFKCSDLQRAVRQQIFDPDITYLTKSVGVADTHIPCLATDLTKFKAVAHDASYTDHPSATVSYIRIEDEIVCHSGLFTHGTDGVSFQVVQRGALNSKAAEHVMDSGASSERKLKITEHIFIEGPAPKVIYALLTGELYGQSAQLPTKWHLGISTAYIALSDFLALGPDYWDTATNTGRHVRFEGEKKTDGKKFIETELLLWLGAYMPVYANGTLGLRRLAPVLSNSGYIVKLDRSNIVDYSELVHDYGAVINQIEIKWNHVFLKEDYTKTTYLIDADSYAIHGNAPVKNLKFKGIKTGSHADADIASYFDTLRDRYAGPPLRLNITVKPSLNWLEVGDTVRVDLDEIRDFTNSAGTKLDRVFEIQQVSHDWFTGDVKLELFGSSMKAGTLVKTALSSVLADSFYNSAGTNLTSVLTIVGGAVTESGTLTGAATMAAGIYYYLGDLTINAGVIVSITQNVQLRIRGHLTINGKIDGKGQGGAGGAGATFWSNGLTTMFWAFNAPSIKHNAGIGGAGYLGITAPTRLLDNISAAWSYTAPAVMNKAPSVPYFALANRSTSIAGLPTDLRGVGGSGGDAQISSAGAGGGVNRTIRVAGTAGGNGGAGFMGILRGLSFGAAGVIDLSGNDAIANTNASWVFNGTTYHGMSGAGGSSGGLGIFLDGNHTPPELVTELISLHGNCPYAGDRNLPGGGLPAHNYGGTPGIAGYDIGDSAYSLQYIPEYKPIEEELPPPPPNVTGFAAVNDGLHARLTWTAIANVDVEKYRIKSGTVWSSGTFIADTAATELRVLMSTVTTYNFMVKAVDYLGQESAAVASASVAGAPVVSLHSNIVGAFNFLSATFFYHQTFNSLENLTVSYAALSGGGVNIGTGPSGYSGYVYGRNYQPLQTLVWTRNWHFKCPFIIAATSGAYMPATGAGTCVGIGGPNFSSNQGVGIAMYWNAGTSLIDIYAYARSYGSVTTALITSIADTGIKVIVEGHFTAGVNFQAIINIGGTNYTATITTNLPATGNLGDVMSLLCNVITGLPPWMSVSDFVCVEE